MMGIKEDLLLWFTRFLIKSWKATSVNIPLEFNEQLAKELHKAIIRKFKKAKVYSGFKDKTWGADLANMKLTNKFNKGSRFLLCAIDIFRKYAWVVPLKDKKGVSIVNALQKILKESDRKPNKTWVGKESKFYNNPFKKWLKNSDIEMYSIHNAGKSVVAERFIRTLKTKIYKYMTSVSKNVYIDKLHDIVVEYNNTYHKTIKMEPVDVKDNTYIDFKKEVNDKDPKFKVGRHVRISKYKYIFAKVYTPNWPEEILLLVKLKVHLHGHILLMISMVKKLLEDFMKKNCKRLINKNLEQKKWLGEKEINYMSNGKITIVYLIVGLIKKIRYNIIV